MKSRSIILSLAAVLVAAVSVVGCASSSAPEAKPERGDLVAAAVRPVAKNVVNLVLANNPKYDEALLALAAASEAALNGGILSVESIAAFVDALAARHKLDATAKLVIASGIDDLAAFYRDTYGQSIVLTTDPQVRRILTAFAAGVRDGVTLYRALTPIKNPAE